LFVIPGTGLHIDRFLMKAHAFAVLLLVSPIGAFAQLNENPGSPRGIESVTQALEAINSTIDEITRLVDEYDALHIRRVQLQSWVTKEHGTEVRDQTVRAHPSRVQAARSIAEARVDMKSTSHPEDLAYINQRLQEHLDELRAGIRAEKGSIASLTVELERLRNEDIPPMN
jgi:hypothetical protein